MVWRKAFQYTGWKSLTYFASLQDRFLFMEVSLFHQETGASMHAYSSVTDLIAHIAHF